MVKKMASLRERDGKPLDNCIMMRPRKRYLARAANVSNIFSFPLNDQCCRHGANAGMPTALAAAFSSRSSDANGKDSRRASAKERTIASMQQPRIGNKSLANRTIRRLSKAPVGVILTAYPPSAVQLPPGTLRIRATIPSRTDCGAGHRPARMPGRGRPTDSWRNVKRRSPPATRRPAGTQGTGDPDRGSPARNHRRGDDGSDA